MRPSRPDNRRFLAARPPQITRAMTPTTPEYTGEMLTHCGLITATLVTASAPTYQGNRQRMLNSATNNRPTAKQATASKPLSQSILDACRQNPRKNDWLPK